MPSGADLEYARLLKAAGVSNPRGYDGARLEQLSDSIDVPSSLNLRHNDIDLLGTSNCYTVLKNMIADGIAAGYKVFKGVPGATYKIVVPQGENLVSLVNTDDIVLDFSSCVIDNSGANYAFQAAFTNIFQFDNCRNPTLLIGKYLGKVLPDPLVSLGYQGEIVLRCQNGTKDTKFHAYIENCRYALQTGDYSTASTGNCSGFDLDIRGKMIGYPIAAYLADDIRHYVHVEGCHRAVYIAGCNDVRGVAKWKDQYIADIAYLLTDTLTSGTDAAAQIDPVGAATTSRGCSNIDVESIDLGSTVYTDSSACAGIGLQRVDPSVFSNIKIKVYTKGTDTVSPKMGGFKLISGAKAVWNRYPFNWESDIVIENLEVSGIIDHSAVTGVGNSGSELYVYTYDVAGHAGTVRNLFFRDLIIKLSQANNRPQYMNAPGLVGPCEFKNFVLEGTSVNSLSLLTNGTYPTIFDGCVLEEILDLGVTAGNNIIVGKGSVIKKMNATTSSRFGVAGNGIIGGSGPQIKTREFLISPLSGASVSLANAILAGEMVLSVQGYLRSIVTGATGYQVGVAGALTRYVDTNTLAAGSSFGPAQAAVSELAPRIYQASTPLVVTAKTSNFTSGIMRIIVTYIDFGTPNN